MLTLNLELRNSFLCSRNWLKQRHFSNKVTSDEKLLNAILTEERDADLEDDINYKDKDGNSSYRKASSLSKFQVKSSSSNITADPNKPPPIGPKYWRSKYRQSYRKVEKGLISPLDEYVARNMDVIESYNEKHKKSLENRIKLDINRISQWDDVIHNYSLRKAILRYLTKSSSNKRDKPSLTFFQQRFFALMSGYASTVAKGPSGCGKSLSIITSALSLRRSNTRGKGINSLLLVKSNTIVFQYQRIINGIISEMNNKGSIDVNKIVQFLYRGTPEEEMQQDDNLTDFQTPHILVTTPQRLLDVLSSRGMDFVKINTLAYIGVDDFTSMIDENDLIEAEKKEPIVQLLDYVLKLQDYRRQHNDPHPQVVITADDSATDSLIAQLKEHTKWIDWNKFAPIGRFGEEEDVPYYKYVASNAAVSTVLVSPRFLENSENSKFKVSLYDMKKFEYGDTPSSWLETLYRKSFGNSQVYKKHRNSKWSNIPMSVKRGELEILCSGLGKLLKKNNVLDWLNKNNNRGLVVHTDELNSNLVVEILSKKTGSKVRVFDVRKDYNIFKTDPIENKDDAELLVINTSSLNGLALPNLKTIFILGVDTIKNVSNLASLIGRCRLMNGLTPEKEFTVFAKNEKVIEDEFVPSSRTFIILPMLPDGTVDPLERNFLERAYLLNGMIKQLSAVGYEENWTDIEQTKYKTAINGSFNDDYDMPDNIVFNGIHSINENESK
jgi:hypothetical protein